MTEQVAIKHLQDHFEIHDDGRPHPFLDEAVSMAIKALAELALYKEGGLCLVPADTFKKQRPVIHKGYYGCKNCGVIKSMRQKNNYCHYCGKGFDWENPERMEEV